MPNLNKWKYTKLHRKKRLKNMGKGNKGKKLNIYNSGLVFKSSLAISFKQFDTLRKFVSKKLKYKPRVNRKNFKALENKLIKKVREKNKEKTVIFRRNFNLGLTKKPSQVRMGKGKGAIDKWVYPYSKNRVFLEFLTNKYKRKKLTRIFRKLETKLPIKIKIRDQVTKKIKSRKKSFRKFYRITGLKCVKVQ